MATITNDLTILSQKQETVATTTINGWNLTFTYKNLKTDKPTEFTVIGNQTEGTGTMVYTKNSMTDSFQFMSGASFDQELVKEVLDKIAAILAA